MLVAMMDHSCKIVRGFPGEVGIADCSYAPVRSLPHAKVWTMRRSAVVSAGASPEDSGPSKDPVKEPFEGGA